MKRVMFVVVLLVALLACGVSATTRYHVFDIGDLGGGASRAYGLNDSGQVVGWSTTATGESRAFLWNSGSGIENLGVLGGYGGEAYGLNDSGQVVGIAYTAGHTSPNDGMYRAFVWSASTGMSGLEALYPNMISVARGINASGQIIANVSPGGADIRAVVWDGQDGIESIGPLGGDYREGFAINDVGQVVGRAGVFGGVSQAFIWDSTNGIQPVGPSYGWGGSTGYGINNLGCVAGSFRPASGGIHAFRWTEFGGIEDLGGPTGPLGVWGEATDINDSRQVVGWSKFSDTEFHALFWDTDGTLSDLNDLLDAPSAGWTLAAAQAINNKGQIAAIGFHNGQMRGVLLNPVPEPASLLLALGGFGTLLGLRRRK